MSIYYLYVKTHNITGLKYLGKTQKNPFIYKGSGYYWLKHLKEHGNDVTTEILKECETNEEVKKWGMHYSNLWNVVDALNESTGKKQWANLKPEYGDGGPQSSDSIQKGLETKRKNGTLNVNTQSSVQKCIETKRKNGTLDKSYTRSAESIQKCIDTKKKNGTLNPNTPSSCEKRKQTMKLNGTTTCTPESAAKGVETKRKNGTLTHSPESIAKMVSTRKSSNSFARSPESIAKQRATIQAKKQQQM